MAYRHSPFRHVCSSGAIRCSFADGPRPGLIEPRSFHSPAEPPSGLPPKEPRVGPCWLVWILLFALGAGMIVVLLPRDGGEGGPASRQEPREAASSNVLEAESQSTDSGSSLDKEETRQDVVPLPREEGMVRPAEVKVENGGVSEVDREGRRKASDALEEVLVKRHELEEKGVAEWGGDAYESVQRQSEAGDDLMLRRSYAKAQNVYQGAAADCDALLAKAPAALMQLLRDGAEAFEQTNGVLSVRKFEAATQLDPASEVAQRSLRRARTLDQVGALLRSAARHEVNKAWGEALIDYQEAVDLDPQFEAASKGLARVTRAMKEERFQSLMSEGLQALQGGALDRAETVLRRAEVLRPGSSDIRNALFQVEEARRVLRIRAVQAEATEAEREGDWERAYTLHKDVLALDAHIQASLEGLDRNASRIRLVKAMSAYVEDPKLLRTEQGREQAGSVLAEAKGLQSEAAPWTALTAALGEQLRLASTPVSLVITSDGFTEVDVYRVGRFGAFRRHTVSVLPGTYTLLGHRTGYKDERRQVTVEPGDETEISVVCRDRI